MQKLLIIIGLAASVNGLSGCAATNQVFANRTNNVEHYRIFAIETDAARSAVATAASAPEQCSKTFSSLADCCKVNANGGTNNATWQRLDAPL
jgi:hypothetical protein